MSTAHGSGPMSQQPADEQPGPTGGTSRNTAVLIDSVARLRRILTIATGVLVALELLWCVGGGMTGGVARPTGTFPVAAVATALLLASTWWVLAHMVRSGMGLMAAWMGGGYLARISLLALVLLGGRVIGLDTRVIGVSLIVAVLVSLFAEVTVLTRARILAVEPMKGGSTGRS